MTSTQLVLVRHGEAHCNVRGLVGGPRGCTGLTDLGRRQAHHLARRLLELERHAGTPESTALYTSPLRRTRETAGILGNTLRLPAQVHQDLREPDYGQADARPWTEVVAEFGRIPAEHPDRPIAADAETWSAHLHRVSNAVHALLDRHQGQTLLIVGHGDTIAAVAHLLLGLPVTRRRLVNFAAHNASITIWQQQPLSWTRPESGWRWALLTHNDVAHLGDAAAARPDPSR